MKSTLKMRFKKELAYYIIWKPEQLDRLLNQNSTRQLDQETIDKIILETTQRLEMLK